MTTKVLLAGCFLYFCLALGDASSFSHISNLVSNTLRDNLPSRAYANVYGDGITAKRYKRDVATQHLDDPENCVRHCSQNESNTIMTSTVKHIAKLVALSLKDLQGDEFDTPEKEEEFKKKVEDTTIDNLGPFFDDLCSASKAFDQCILTCPSSKLREIMVLNHTDSEALCEHQKRWTNFREFYNALNCTNATEYEHLCDNKCGQEVDISNVTQFDFQEADLVGYDLTFETDKKKSTDSIGPVCKNIFCRIDCYKPIMTDRCGAKAFDLYTREEKLDARTTLRVLQKLNAVDKNNDCKGLQ